MPVQASDIIEFKSTQSGSLGGTPDTGSPITDNTTHNVWDIVSSQQSADGVTEYRCIFVKNEHDTLTLQNAKVWVQTNTPSSSTSVEIALGSTAVGSNPNEPTIASETTTPSHLPGANGTAFSAAATEGAALSIGNIGANQYKAIWIKRVVTAGAAAFNDDNYVLSYAGDTAA